MGLTPVSGLPGATRSGTIDPTLVFHYTHNAAKVSHDKSLVTPVGVTEAEDILNKKSGWQALAGTSDFGEIIRKKDGDEDARLAYDIFEDRILDLVGAYWLKLGGKVDALVFSGGVGEKGKELRDSVIERCACIGFAMDRTRNNAVDDQEGDVAEVGKDGQRNVLVCRTDEQVYPVSRIQGSGRYLCVRSSRWRDNVPGSLSSGNDSTLLWFESPSGIGIHLKESSEAYCDSLHVREHGDVPMSGTRMAVRWIKYTLMVAVGVVEKCKMACQCRLNIYKDENLDIRLHIKPRTTLPYRMWDVEYMHQTTF
jgi:Acetokinase family